MEVKSRNVTQALQILLLIVREYGVREVTRNGPVLSLNEPVMLRLDHPWERVLAYPNRNENPFFHLAEAVWMLQGRDDVHGVSRYNKQMKEYSDDGNSFNGAYGYRWREHFMVDQLDELVKLLRKEPNTRRAVLTMWDPTNDLNYNSKDLPCNTHIYFDCRGGKLNMTVCNRSNDLIWGLCGANAVHMSFLQEYMAGKLELSMGPMRTMTNNLHVYLESGPGERLLDELGLYSIPPYDELRVAVPLIHDDAQFFDEDLETAADSDVMEFDPVYKSRWFREVYKPIVTAWNLRKRNREACINQLTMCRDDYWYTACSNYLARTWK